MNDDALDSVPVATADSTAVLVNKLGSTVMDSDEFEFDVSPADSTEGPAKPLRVMFMLTSMPFGGAETLLVNLVQRMNEAKFRPEICCLKELGPLGEQVAQTFPASSNLIRHKFDVSVLGRLAKLMEGRVDALVTVGAGDKMFWGRLAARWVKTPVVISALHSTGWPDGLGRLNRMLTPWTDGFVAVASAHAQYLIEQERLPKAKVHVIPNGVDTQRFAFRAQDPYDVRREFGIPAAAPICGIVAALRPEKNHRMFVDMAELVSQHVDAAHFMIVGDGPDRPAIERRVAELGLQDRVHFTGTRSDIPRLLAAFNVFCLTSDNEANPVSILEALSTQVPVVATDVGSVAASVRPNETGFLVPPGKPAPFAEAVIEILQHPQLAQEFGDNGRHYVVQQASLEKMVRGYEQLIWDLYRRRQGPGELTERLGENVDFCGATT